MMTLRDSCTPTWVQVHEPSHTQKCPRVSYKQHPMRLIPNWKTNDLYLANKHRSVGDEEESWHHCVPFFICAWCPKNHPHRDLFGSEVSKSMWTQPSRILVLARLRTHGASGPKVVSKLRTRTSRDVMRSWFPIQTSFYSERGPEPY